MESIENENDQKRTFKWWFITWNNPPKDWKEALVDLSASYCIGQLEKGSNGTPHIQALLYWPTSKRPSYWKYKPVWAKGISQADATLRVQNYVTKSETRIDGPFEAGTPPKSLQKNGNWDDAKRLAKEGRFDEINASIYIRYYGNLKKIYNDSTKGLTADKVRGCWIYGPPGWGKTHYARNLGDEDMYLKPQNKWWDGYQGQEIVILDDLDKNGACLGHYFKIWADKWACTGEIKGGTVPLQHRVFIVTSNYLPTELWEDPTLIAAITRRFYFVIFFGNRQYTEYFEEGPGYYPHED